MLSVPRKKQQLNERKVCRDVRSFSALLLMSMRTTQLAIHTWIPGKPSHTKISFLHNEKTVHASVFPWLASREGTPQSAFAHWLLRNPVQKSGSHTGFSGIQCKKASRWKIPPPVHRKTRSKCGRNPKKTL